MSSLNMLPTLQDFGNVNSNLVQINSARSVAILTDTTTSRSDNFSSGVVDFQLSLSQNQRLSCSKSYFRAECSVAVKDTTYRQPKTSDNFALAENFMNNIISNSYMYIGNKSVSNVSQYHGVCAMLRSRLTKSFSWFETMGKSVYYLDPDFSSRQKNITSDSSFEALTAVELGYDVADTCEIKTADLLRLHLVKGATPALPDTSVVWQAGDRIQVQLTTGTFIRTVASVTNDIITVTTAFPALQAVATVIVYGLTRMRDLDQVPELADGRNNLQVCFQLPLSPFYNDQCIPTSDIRFSIFPASSKNGAFEYAEAAGGASPAPADVSLLISNLYFFAYVFDGDKNFVDGTYY